MSLFYPSRQNTPFTILSNPDSSYNIPNADLGINQTNCGSNSVIMASSQPPNFVPQIVDTDLMSFTFTSVAESVPRQLSSFKRTAIGARMPLVSNKYKDGKPYIFDIQCSWEFGSLTQSVLSFSLVVASAQTVGASSSRVLAIIPFSDLPEGHLNHRIIQTDPVTYSFFHIGLMCSNYTLSNHPITDTVAVSLAVRRSFEPLSVNDGIII